jgi:hypothetical protein
MPSRRQRQRRAKTFRHEYGFVEQDDEGNVVDVDMSQVRAEKKKPDKPKPAAAATSQGRGRAGRVAQPPSWNRALKRGGVWGGLMLVVVVFFFKGMPIGARVAWGLLYAAAFIPLTYWIDRVAYRSYQKRLGKPPEPRPGRTSKP